MDYHGPLEYANGRIRSVSRGCHGLTEQGISYTVHHYERGVQEYKENITLLRRKCEELIQLLKRREWEIENKVSDTDVYCPRQDNKLVCHDDFEYEGFGFYDHGHRTVQRNTMSSFEALLSLRYDHFDFNLDNELNQIRYELHQMENQCKRNEDEMSLFKCELKKKEMTIKRLKDDIIMIERDYEEVELENKNLQDRLRSTIVERNQLKERNADLQTEMAAVFDTYTHSSMKGKSQINHNKVMKISDKETILRKKLNSEIESRRVTEIQLSKEKINFDQCWREQQKMKTEYERSLSSLKKEKLDLENSLKVYNAKVEALEKKLNRCKNTSHGNKSASTDKLKARDTLINDNTQKQSFKAAYKVRNEGEDVNYTLKLKAECQGKTEQISELEQRLQETSRTLENKNSKLRALKSELAQCKTDIESYRMKYNELNERCEKLQKKIKNGEKQQMQIYEQAEEVQQGFLRQVSQRERKLIKENEMQKKKIQQLQNEQHLRKEQTINPENIGKAGRLGTLQMKKRLKWT